MPTPVLSVPLGFGCFHPSTHVSGDEERLLPGKPLHAQQSETGQGDSRWIGRHVWTDARCAICLIIFCLFLNEDVNTFVIYNSMIQ